jgi:hypothetical protein
MSGDVVIAMHAHFGREVAVDLLDERWLNAWTPERVSAAFDVAGAAAPGEVVWLLHSGICVNDRCDRRWAERDDATELDDWRSTSLHEISWLGGNTYVLEEFEPS